MNLTVEIPDDIAARLSDAEGDLSRRTLKALLKFRSLQARAAPVKP